MKVHIKKTPVSRFGCTALEMLFQEKQNEGQLFKVGINNN